METIDQIIGQSCQRNAERCALQHRQGKDWTDTSYKALWSEAESLASGLNELGISQKSHIAILAPSSPSWVVSYLGVLRNSCIVVPIDKDLKATEMRHILADAEVTLIFAGRQQLSLLLKIIDDLPQLKQIVLLDTEDMDRDDKNFKRRRNSMLRFP